MSAIFVISDHYDELKTVFDKLADGAEKERFQELHDLPFGIYGQFYDRYGVQWIFKGDARKLVIRMICPALYFLSNIQTAS
jgi:PhnB protein